MVVFLDAYHSRRQMRLNSCFFEYCIPYEKNENICLNVIFISADKRGVNLY